MGKLYWFATAMVTWIGAGWLSSGNSSSCSPIIISVIVSVSCSDGSAYEGSIVIGADGAYSRTRKIMHHLATTRCPSLPWDPSTPYTTEYRRLWCTCPRMDDPGQYFETQCSGRSVISISGHEREWMLLFEKLTQASSEKGMSSAEEMEHFAATFAHFPANNKHTVQDIFSKRLTSGMTTLEEGMLQHWYLGRMVLVGDACHKMTPNASFGFNSGVQDAVVLCNYLQIMLKRTPAGDVKTSMMTSVFQQYQSCREGDVRKDLSYSAQLTRTQAWANWFYYFLARWIRPWKLVQWFSAQRICVRFSRRSLLDYGPAQESFNGSVAWLNPMPQNLGETNSLCSHVKSF